MPVLIQHAAFLALLGFTLWALCRTPKPNPRPLFRCSRCHRDIYPPVIKSMHYRDKSYCAECEAKYWQEAEALRARMK